MGRSEGSRVVKWECREEKESLKRARDGGQEGRPVARGEEGRG